MDYIFEVYFNNEDDVEEVKNEKTIRLHPESLKVEKFCVCDYKVFNQDHQEKRNNKSRLYTNLSDHYGLSIELSLNNFQRTHFLEETKKIDDCILEVLEENNSDEVRLLVEG